MPDDQQNAVQTPKKPRSTNLRISANKQTIVAALLSQNVPHRSITESTGVSAATIQKIKHKDLASSEQAEKIKKGLRSRWALLADQALTTLTDDKLGDASAKDLAYIAAKATEMAGLSPPSIVETYTKSIQSFLIPETPQPIAVAESHTKTVQCTNVNNT